MERWGTPRKEIFKNYYYRFICDPKSFQNVNDIKNVQIDDYGSLASFRIPLHEAMDRIEQLGERFYLSFSSKFAEHNTELRLDVEKEISRLKPYFGNKVQLSNNNYMTHTFLYHGDAFQTQIHQAMIPDFSFQFAGTKLWRFIHPNESWRVFDL